MSEWQDINTVPQDIPDGQRALVCCDHGVIRHVVWEARPLDGAMATAWWTENDTWIALFTPSMWMPIDEPPLPTPPHESRGD